MKKTSIIYLIVAALILSSCASKAKKERTITLSGAFALYPLVIKWTEEYKKVNPEVRFNISGGGAGKGLADALAEVVDLGMFSREITPFQYIYITLKRVYSKRFSDNNVPNEALGMLVLQSMPLYPEPVPIILIWLNLSKEA